MAVLYCKCCINLLHVQNQIDRCHTDCAIENQNLILANKCDLSINHAPYTKIKHMIS
jgi:hypothetical protein